MKAIWNNKVIAESSDILNVDGFSYFPVESVNKEYLKDSEAHSICPWKGTASYYDLVVDGKTNKKAGWYYPEPSELAQAIKGRIGFWNGVQIVKD